MSASTIRSGARCCLLQLAVFIACTRATDLVFRIGASIGKDGACAPLYEQTARGYEYFFSWLEQANVEQQLATDLSGRKFSLRLQFSLITHNCTESGRQLALDSLVNGRKPDPARGDPGQEPVHILLGGNGENALEDSIQADNASRVLIHCCTARDSVYMLDLPNIYGIFTPASMYTGAVLRAMAFSGIKRVAVVYTNESPLHLQLCNGALRQLPPLTELRPGFGSSIVINYTIAESQQPDFWERTAAKVAQSRPDALIACDEMARTSQLVKQLHNRGQWLSALWLASYGNVSDFLSYLGGAGAYSLTTMQWLPSLPYADPAFGTAADFASAFTAATGMEASYFSAAATTTGYVLLNVLHRAVSDCNLSSLDSLTADAFMWQEGAMTCQGQSRGVQYQGISGQLMMRHVLDRLHMDTFFGPVGFNNYRQNVYHPPVVAQVLDNELTVVVPLDLAERQLVMPIPQPLPPGRSWASTTTGIVIISLVACLVGVCVVLVGVVGHRWLRPRLSLAMEVEIDPAEVQVDLAPTRNVDGTFEPGEGMYRGTRVKLVVATELLPQPLPPPPTAALLLGLPMLPGKAPTVHMPPAPSTGAGSPGSPHYPRINFLARVSNPAREASSLSQLGRVTLREMLYRRAPESSSDQLPTPARSMSGTPAALSKRIRKQLTMLLWRALRLQHPRICPILGIAWEWPGLLDGVGTVPVIVRQWYELGDLAQVLENETVPLPLLTKLNIAQGVAEGLAYLHAQEPPIIAGPLEASRIIIDKHFNPHVFVRLQNLDPNPPPPPPPAHPLGPQRSTSRLGPHGPTSTAAMLTGGLFVSSGGLWRSPGSGHASQVQSGANPAATPTPALLVRSRSAGISALAGTSQRVLRQCRASTATAYMNALCALPSGTAAAAADGPGDAPAFVEGGGNGGDGSSGAAAHHVLLIDATGAEPTDINNTLYDHDSSSTRALADAPCPTPLLEPSSAVYVRSQAQDVYEFGRLLGHIFVAAVSQTEDGMRSKTPSSDFAERSSARVGAAAAAAGPNGVGTLSGALTRHPAPVVGVVLSAAGGGELSGSLDVQMAQQATSPGTPRPSYWQVDDDSQLTAQSLRPNEDVLIVQALEGICPELAELARSCMHADPAERPSFAAVAAILDKRVKMALSQGRGLAGVSHTGRMGFGGMGSMGGMGVCGHYHHQPPNGGGAADAGSGGYGRVAPVAAGMSPTPRSVLQASNAEQRRHSVEAGAVGRRRSLMLRGSPAAMAASGAARRSESFRQWPPVPAPDWLSGVRRHIMAPDDLLFDLFPPKVAHALRAGETVQPERYDCVSIFFSDMVGYTDLCAQLQPHEVMDLMHRLYSQFDALIQSLRLFKVETVGDAYLAVGNLRWPQPNTHARLAAQFAFAAVRAANLLPIHPERPELGCVRIRVGLHCGPVVGSVVGTLNRRYCLFGDAVNTAARMEHNSEANRVHCSGAFAALVAEQWPEAVLASRGVRAIKGKGPMETFWVKEPDSPQELAGFVAEDTAEYGENDGGCTRPPSSAAACGTFGKSPSIGIPESRASSPVDESRLMRRSTAME